VVLGAAVALLVVAFVLAARRDLGTGVLPPRLGPPTAAPGLRTPLALAWRLQRGSLQGWITGTVLVGLVIGAVAHTVTDQLLASPALRDRFARAGGISPGDLFFTFGLGLLGQVVAGYTIAAALRLHREELDMRVDPVLATSVSRLGWAASHVLVAALGTALLLVGFGLAAGLTYGLSAGTVSREAPRVLGATLAYLPAVWLLGGVAVALWGIAPRLAPVSWAVLVACLVLELLGELRAVGQPLRNLSPFTHVPRVLTGDSSLVPLAGLLAMTALLTTTGLLRFRQRDVG
jgi:ABC-2 type transport system permease protein